MAVVSIASFQTETGRLADHLAVSAEAVTHLHRMGLQSMLVQPVAGGDIGRIAVVTNFADNATYATQMQAIQADQQWQEFYAGAAAGGSANQVESTLLTDVDPNYAPDPDRPLGVFLTTQWRAKDGRLVDFMAKVAESVPHTTRLGGATRVMQSVIGAHPLSVLISTTFADMDAYGAYADRINADAEWQEFWAGALSDPTGDLIRSGLYLNITPA